MCQFIESIKIENGIAFLLHLHQQRVNQTFAQFKGKNTLDLLSIFKTIPPPSCGLFKWRIVYDLNGNFESQFIPYTFSDIQNFELVENNNINYDLKFLDRTALNNLKNNALAQEIIIVKNNQITDTSFSNLLFLKDDVWYTPKTFLLNGIQRQHLLHLGWIQEKEISKDNLHEFSHFQLINAMNEMNASFIYPTERISII